MRQAGHQLAVILNDLTKMVMPGVKTQEIDAKAAEAMKKAGLQAVLLGYQGYPASTCISVNEQVVHGIPGKTVIQDGDVVKIDVTAAKDGLVVDTATTVVAGQAALEVKKLLEGTQRALYAGIDAIKGDGTKVGDISAAVEDVLNDYKLGIVRDLVGHGVGYGVHEMPNVPNYGSAGSGPKLSAGITIAVEPMATLGDWQVGTLRDGWTIITQDGSLAAHFEHTVAVTENGYEILTQL